MYNFKFYKTIGNFIFGRPTIESITAPLSKIRDQLDDLITVNVVEQSENDTLIRELTQRNTELEADNNAAISVVDKFSKLLS